MTKRLAFFIPLAASMPLWVGALPQAHTVGSASAAPAGHARAAESPSLQEGFALAEPDANETIANDNSIPTSMIEDLVGPAEATAGPSHSSAVASNPAPPTVRPAAETIRRARPAVPVRLTQHSVPRPVKIRMRVTGYCPCRECCGRWSAARRTACGQSVYTNHSRFVAADTSVLPFGRRVSVPGYHGGATVPVLDRGSLIVGRRLDVFFLSHPEAKRWGSRWLEVTVYRD